MVFLQSLRSYPLGGKLKGLVGSGAWDKRPGLFVSLCAVTLISSLLLGGGTRGGFLSDTILEILAIPAFLVSLSSLIALPRSDSRHGAQWPLLLCLAIVVLPLIQLVPLPPWLWTKLPQREEMVTVFGLLGRELPWLPISVSPNATWVSVLSLLAPLAIFLGVVQLGYRERRQMSLIILGFGLFAAFLGLVQVAQGPSSPFRFFAITSDVEPVGFFANRNHFAALLYSLLLLGAAWTADVAFTVGAWKDRKSLETSSIAILTGSLLSLVILITVDAITRSRAGLGLMIVAITCAFVLAIADRRRPSSVTPVKLICGSALLVLLLVVQFGLYRIFDRFAVDPVGDARIPFARNTIAAAKAYMPFGSGVGTFVTVYPTFEPPQDTIANVYANHAHNDLLEAWLEGGIVSILIFVAFVTWFVMRAVKLWWRAPDDVRSIDLLLARAATFVIPLIIAHCLVDYPLRTGAMMAVFAFCCALLIDPLVPVTAAVATRPNGVFKAAADQNSSMAVAPLMVVTERPPAAAGKPPGPEQRWGEDVEWPDEWRK